MREIIQTKQFRRDYRKIASCGKHSLENFIALIELLSHDKRLPEKYRDHALTGEWKGSRECHIKPDWLLIYEKRDDKLILARMGSHSELFR